MGLCDSIKKENNENTNGKVKEVGNPQPLKFSITKEDYIPENDKSLTKSLNNNVKIRKQMEKSICKIDGQIEGTGFLCNNINSKIEINIDNILTKLLIARNYIPGKEINLKEEEIKYLIDKSLPIIKNEKTLLELEAPLHVCGDIHGQFYDLLRIFEYAGYPGEYNYLFLGNYIDFGKQSLEVICLLLCYKIKYPEKMYLLRGNHESSVTNRIYGFYEECKRRYNVRIWRSFTDLFNWLPFAAIIDDKIFCVHGGLSPYLKNFQNILDISRPTDIPDIGLICDLMWSDPDKDVIEYDENENGFSVIFGEKIVQDFIRKNNLDLIIRGNQMVHEGYEFFAQRRLITIFSAPNFKEECRNSAGIVIIDKNLTCTLKVLRPVENLEK